MTKAGRASNPSEKSESRARDIVIGTCGAAEVVVTTATRQIAANDARFVDNRGFVLQQVTESSFG